MNEKVNVVFLLSIPFPNGMASTKRVQRVIDGLQAQGVHSHVLVTRQLSNLNRPEGVFKDVPYKTLMPNLVGKKLALKLPVLFIKTVAQARRLFNPAVKNILYIYDYPAIDNIFALLVLRKLGYKIVFDIVEDADHAKDISEHWRHRLKVFATRKLTDRILSIADGVVVISTALQAKFYKLTRGRMPLHYLNISIDAALFKSATDSLSVQPTLLYSGSFGVKDGISHLLEAFDILAAKHPEIRLVMTGRGTETIMRAFLKRISVSPARKRIEYKGYVSEDEYYRILASVDIPCMTRIDSDYANAGFPFKLGEFLATGKPVIASRVSDVEALFKDRQDAMLVRPGDSADIAEKVDYLLANPDQAAAIGKKGRAKALALFDYRAQGADLFRFLQAL